MEITKISELRNVRHWLNSSNTPVLIKSMTNEYIQNCIKKCKRIKLRNDILLINIFNKTFNIKKEKTFFINKGIKICNNENIMMKWLKEELIYRGKTKKYKDNAGDVYEYDMVASDWLEIYKPIRNHLDKDTNGTMFETYGSELQFVKSNIKNNNVWTLFDDNTICSGYWIVNRLGYYVTEESHNDKNIIILDDFSDQIEILSLNSNLESSKMTAFLNE